MNIKKQLPILLLAILCVFTVGGTGCATKKYVRQSVNERVTPLEGRTQELEETVRRNTQDIQAVDQRLSKQISDVDAKTNKAQQTADQATQAAQAADSKAQAADARAAGAEQRVENLRENLDKFTPLTTISVNFKVNSAILSPESKAQLDGLAAEAKNHKGYLLEIQGFTDSTGSVSANDQLSQDRAETVQRYLAKEHQIPIYKMSILGLGKLTEDTRSKEARAQNRRVDVRLLINNAVTPSGLQTSSN